MKNFAQFGVCVPDILVPRQEELSVWSVIACDQYTQDESYWDSVAAAVGEKPSTLNLILPEVYLSAPDRQRRIDTIHQTMQDYLSRDVFAPPVHGFVYVERKTAYGRLRKGLVVAVDLDAYEWKPQSRSLIRATEATIVERIPPRKAIRQNAPLESPHIMLLVNDPQRSLIERVGERAKQEDALYDGDLMLNAGHVTGWAVRSPEAFDAVFEALQALRQAGTDVDGSSFLCAVGDGNHSLATAKAVWDEHREQLRAAGASEAELAASPVRYALVELVNIYDEGLTFEPIHRVLFHADGRMLADYVQAVLGGELSDCDSAEALEQKVQADKASFGFAFCDAAGAMQYSVLKTDVTELAVSRLQPVLDDFIAATNARHQADAVTIDYIHGSDEVFRLGQKAQTVGLLLPPVAKDSFFATINAHGPLPRKSFSMGEASEKRFYLECRRLFGQ